MKNTVHNDGTSSNLKGKPMTKTIGLHWLQQVTKHVPATDEASVHRAQLRVKPLYCLLYVGDLFSIVLGRGPDSVALPRFSGAHHLSNSSFLSLGNKKVR